MTTSNQGSTAAVAAAGGAPGAGPVKSGSDGAGRGGLKLDIWIAALGRMSDAHPDMARILHVVERLQDRPYRSHAVIYGEPGTGKEGLARLLHRLMHPGAVQAPLERVQLSGRSESEQAHLLFGDGVTEVGALARARGGSLVLDELLALSAANQRRLYEALQSSRSGSGPGGGAMVIAVTDSELPTAVAEGRFRHDLAYRLLRIVLHVPPLRERDGDMAHSVLWICNRVLKNQGSHGGERPAELCESGERAATVSTGAYRVLPAAIAVLREHRWPGNFRELEAVLERAVLLYSDGDQLLAEDVRRALHDNWPPSMVGQGAQLD